MSLENCIIIMYISGLLLTEILEYIIQKEKVNRHTQRWKIHKLFSTKISCLAIQNIPMSYVYCIDVSGTYRENIVGIKLKLFTLSFIIIENESRMKA